MSNEEAERPQNVGLGVIVIVLTVFAMSFADAVVKYVSATFPLWQIYVVRSLVVIPILSAITLFGPRPVLIRPDAKGWAFLRGLLLALMYIAIYAAVPVLSLSVIAASLYTAPLFIALFSALLIGEPVGLRRWTAIVIGFVGVLVILRPATDAFSPLALIPIIAALLYALAAIITRSKCAEEPPMLLALALNFSLLAVGAAATAVIALWCPTPSEESFYPFLFGYWVAMGPRESGIIALLAALMVAISLGLAKAYQSAPAPIIATFDYSYLLFAAFWSFVIFAQPPDAPTILGMLMIAGAGLLVVREPRTRPRDASEAAGSPSEVRTWWPHPPLVRWVERRRQHSHDRRLLATFSDRMLRDIGLDRGSVDRETTTSFWRLR
jgi:drug/metabolite transporter (DMT)-like permease